MKLQVSKRGVQKCQGCGQPAPLRTLDVRTAAMPARKEPGWPLRAGSHPGSPAGWRPLIALCRGCWADVVRMLDATPDVPDAPGEASP